MFKALILHIIAVPIFAAQLLRAVPAEGWRFAWKRIPLFLLIWLLYSLLNIIHLLGHIADELLFFAYRKTALEKPVFILGIPRSGTTYLQRLLNHDDTFTTLATWEALLAPSISEKYIYRGLGWLLRPVYLLLENLFLLIRRKLFHNMDSIHKLHLQEPEEDFLLLLPVLGCLLPAFICPDSKHYWNLAYFDSKLSPQFRNLVMEFYTLCLKKHLYYADSNARLLSKNPSLTSWTDSLLLNFPDAKIIACTRPPKETIPSQLSSLGPAMALLAGGKLNPKTQNTMIELLYSYYLQLGKLHHHKHVFVLSMAELQTQLKTTIVKLYEFLALQPSEQFINTVEHFEVQSRNYSSAHQYNLASFSLTDDVIREKFHDVWPMNSQEAGQ
jgi:omega-hydroxy-beta-dihydromenaquinone-9 sulfotransferase